MLLPRQATRTFAETAVRACCVLFAPALFLSVYIVHFMGPGIPTGFLGHDMAYYSANGRAVFERGNGFVGPNPFDPSPDAPAIYFHWLTWLLGFGNVHLGIEPGMLFCGVGLVASIAFSWFTLLLVEAVLPDSRFRCPLFLFVMWGGGVLCLTQLCLNLSAHQPLTNDLFYFDPSGGLWVLNWGRNSIYPTEAVYHAIAAATWLAVVCHRRAQVLLGAALLATTHPFSGLQLLLMLTVWFGALSFLRPRRINLLMVVTLAGMLSLFLWYYFIYLPSFAQHRALQEVWSLPWLLPVSSMLLAYGPLAFFALYRVFSERLRLPESAWFFVTCFLVSLLLVKHEWFIAPRQPLHFTRGYVWAPLCFLALPLLQKALLRLREGAPALAFGAVFLVGAGLAISDNISFVARWWSWGKVGWSLTADEVATFNWMRRNDLRGVLLCPNEKLGNLAVIYTHARSYFAHPFNTPEFQRRVNECNEWLDGGKPGPWFQMIDYILLSKHGKTPTLEESAWEIAMENTDYVLYMRKAGFREGD